MRDLNHPIDWSNASAMIQCNSFINRNIIESSLIKNSDNINLSSGMFKLDSFIADRISRQVLKPYQQIGVT